MVPDRLGECLEEGDHLVRLTTDTRIIFDQSSAGTDNDAGLVTVRVQEHDMGVIFGIAQGIDGNDVKKPVHGDAPDGMDTLLEGGDGVVDVRFTSIGSANVSASQVKIANEGNPISCV